MTPRRSDRGCIFCGATTGLTREHVVADWITEIFIERGAAPFRGEPSGGDPSNPRPERSGLPRIDMVAKQVCEKVCNSGWMSQMEQDIRPILEPIICGQAPRTLSPMDQIRLARYAVKTMLMAEATAGAASVIPESDYRDFYRTQRPSSRTWVWLGCYKERQLVASFGRLPLYVGDEEDDDGLPVPNGCRYTIQIGHGIFQVGYYLGPDRNLTVEVTEDIERFFIQLWPGTGQAARWPLITLTHDGFMKLMTAEGMFGDGRT